ncbi:MAG TPA: hypothetical protein VF391_08765 [Dermatophilaceae bacterium]
MLLVEPGGELFGHRARRTQQLLASHDLVDHEVAEELRDIPQDVLRAEQVAERFLVPCLIGLVEALCIGLVERLVGIPVERVAKELHHLFVAAHRAGRQALTLLVQERLERLVNGDLFCHAQHDATAELAGIRRLRRREARSS